MSNFKFQKTFLAVSATAAMAGMLVGGQAFAAVLGEQAVIEITSKIITSTCVLNLGGTASGSTAAAKKSLDLGTFSVANVSSMSPLQDIGKGVSVVLALKEAGGGACNALGTGGKWDVLIDLPTTGYNADTNLLNNMTLTTAGGSNGMSVKALRQVNTGTVSSINWSSRSPIGILVSGSSTTANLDPADTVTITAQMIRGYNVPAVGIYTANLPLTVLYK